MLADIAWPARVVLFAAAVGIGAYIGGAVGAVLAVMAYAAAELVDYRASQRDARRIDQLEEQLDEATRPESAIEQRLRVEREMEQHTRIRLTRNGGSDPLC